MTNQTTHVETDPVGWRTITAAGMSIKLPPGWYGRARTESLQLASFRRPREAYFGPKTTAAMRRGSIVIEITNFIGFDVSAQTEARPPISIGKGDIGTPEEANESSRSIIVTKAPALAVRELVIFEQAIQVLVGFGSERPSGEMLEDANGVLATLRVELPGGTLAYRGVSIDLPARWDGRLVSYPNPTAMKGALQGATFDLPEPPVGLSPGEVGSIERMGAENVALMLAPAAEIDGKAPTVSPKGVAGGALGLRPKDFLPSPVHFGPRGRTQAERSFCIHRRCFRLTVELGHGPAEVGLLEQVNAILATLVVADENAPPRPVALMPLPRPALAKCLRFVALHSACPRRIPRTADWTAFARASSGSPAVFDYGHGGPYENAPERNRRPRFVHLTLYGGRVDVGFGGFGYPERGGAAELRNGALYEPRRGAVFFGRVTWASRHGTLVLAPGYPVGGHQGGHLIFRWKEGGREYALGLHAWEPFLETVATLKALVRST